MALSNSDDRGWPAERLLAEHSVLQKNDLVLATSLGAGELIQRLDRESRCRATGFFLDSYAEAKCREQCDAPILRGSDFPEAMHDAILLPVRQDGDAELTRDYLQQSFVALREGGSLWTATNNPQDKWLRQHVDKTYRRSKVVYSGQDGIVYKALRHGDLRRTRDFRAEVTFRFDERILTVVTRPGVFAHRKIDDGARAILKIMKVQSGDDVLDIGAGSGVLALAAATCTNGRVWAIDSNSRSVECIEESAVLNNLGNIETRRTHDGGRLDSEFDVCLANPPYYASFRVASLFLDIARNSLRSNGRLYLVTKFPKWYVENLHRWFERSDIQQVGNYYVVTSM